MSNTPRIGLPLVPQGTLDPAAGLNESIRVLDTLVQTKVISMSLTTPPATAGDGDCYIVGSGATGDWAGHDDDLAKFIDEGNFWEFYTAGVQVNYVFNDEDGRFYIYDVMGSPPGWAQLTVASSVSVQNLDSPPLSIDSNTIVFGNNLTVTDEGGGVARVDAAAGGGGDSNVTADTHPTSPDDADDEFEGAALDTAGTRRSGATPWSWNNQGGATATLAQGHCVVLAPGNASDSLRAIEQAIPSGNWRYRCKLTDMVASLTNFLSLGMCVRRSSNGKILSINKAVSTGLKIEANYWSSATNFGSNIAFSGTAFDAGVRDVNDELYFEIEWDGTTYYFRYSDSGVDGTFITLGSQAAATNLGGAADFIGVFSNSNNSADVVAAFDWFRRMA